MPVRLNKHLALLSGLSRRAADDAIANGRVTVNGATAMVGQSVQGNEPVALDGTLLQQQKLQTILLNKPKGYVVSRNGQGSRTVYELLPPELHNLKPVGRLDKESSGLLLLTNDGNLAAQLTHPRYEKSKRYRVTLAMPLAPLHRQMIQEYGIHLQDGPSRFTVARTEEGNEKVWLITMHEGRNRQIRRTFNALGYEVVGLHRIQFGTYLLPGNLKPGAYTSV